MPLLPALRDGTLPQGGTDEKRTEIPAAAQREDRGAGVRLRTMRDASDYNECCHSAKIQLAHSIIFSPPNDTRQCFCKMNITKSLYLRKEHISFANTSNLYYLYRK